MIYKRGNTWWFEFRFMNERIRMSSRSRNPTIARQAEATERARRARGRLLRSDIDEVPKLIVDLLTPAKEVRR